MPNMQQLHYMNVTEIAPAFKTQVLEKQTNKKKKNRQTAWCQCLAIQKEADRCQTAREQFYNTESTSDKVKSKCLTYINIALLVS